MVGGLLGQGHGHAGLKLGVDDLRVAVVLVDLGADLRTQGLRVGDQSHDRDTTEREGGVDGSVGQGGHGGSLYRGVSFIMSHVEIANC